MCTTFPIVKIKHTNTLCLWKFYVKYVWENFLHSLILQRQTHRHMHTHTHTYIHADAQTHTTQRDTHMHTKYTQHMHIHTLTPNLSFRHIFMNQISHCGTSSLYTPCTQHNDGITCYGSCDDHTLPNKS